MNTTRLLLLFCTVLHLAFPADAQLFVPGAVKREYFPGATRAQVNSTNPPTAAATNFYSAWNAADERPNYTARFSGLIIPTNSGLYDFYLAADDDTDLYISTNDNPTNKYLIAQENTWSPPLNWTVPGAAGGIASQKSSASWTNGLGVSPHAGGINLVAGTRYYLEAVHHNGGGGGTLAVTAIPHGFGIGDGTETVLMNGSPEFIIGIVIPNPTLPGFSSAGQPQSRTVVAGTPAVFRAAPIYSSQIPPAYQWQRGTVSGGVTNYANIPGATNVSFATNSFYTIIASTNDNNAKFRCVVAVPGIGTPTLVRTSGVATLTVVPTGGLTVSGRLKRELFASVTQPAPGHFLTNVIALGNVGPPNAVNTFTSFEIPSAGAQYGERVSGFFTPPATANYVFFIAADDEAQLFVSTNDQPSGKVLVAQEDGFSLPRNWITPGGDGSIPQQKRSDQWVPDPLNPPLEGPPHAAGIPMVAGSRYYIEAIHWGGDPNNHLGATFARTTDVEAGFPLDNDPSAFTGSLISYITRPVTNFLITSQPSDAVRFEGLPYTFRVSVQTDSEITPAFQWRKNGQPITGAVSSNYTAIALVQDNNALFSVDISIPGVGATNSANATLNVIQGTFASGILRREFWTNSSTRGITRPIVGANAGGFPDPDYTLFTDTLDISEARDDNYVQRLSGFFVPPETTNYVFFLSCDDDSDLFISTDEQPANKYLIAQENVWSSARQWLTANGGGDASLKRSDQFNGGIYGAGIPLTAGLRYYLEIVHREVGGGDVVSATYKFIGENDPPNGSATRLTGSSLGTPVPAATALGIVTNPVSVSTHAWQPVYFTVHSTNDSIVPSTYQWRRSNGAGAMTNMPGVTAGSFGFVTSLSDNGAQFDCVVRAPGTSLALTSSIVHLAVSGIGTLIPNSLAREVWNIGVGTGIVEKGALGRSDTDDVISGIDFPTAVYASASMRVRGFFIPPVTTNYTFFISSDDTAVLFLSPDDQPRNKVEIAREEGFSTARSWLSATSGDSNLKHSDTWTADGGVTLPYGQGIWMTNGQRYYLEAIHSQTGGDENFSVTYMEGADPAAYPLAGDPSILLNGVIGYMQAPVIAARPLLTATKSGSTLNVSWTPAGGTLQSTPLLSSGIWNVVGTQNPVMIPITTTNLFLRVVLP
ncbi:MAG TPA: hypothetical protein VEH04_17940 [Verrucomicrobiae bacterium]|nr:hypothetical protein [Verrucomicrobiae bacterium]